MQSFLRFSLVVHSAVAVLESQTYVVVELSRAESISLLSVRLVPNVKKRHYWIM